MQVQSGRIVTSDPIGHSHMMMAEFIGQISVRNVVLVTVLDVVDELEDDEVLDVEDELEVLEVEEVLEVDEVVVPATTRKTKLLLVADVIPAPPSLAKT